MTNTTAVLIDNKGKFVAEAHAQDGGAFVTISMLTETAEQAQQVAAAFPKAAKFYAQPFFTEGVHQGLVSGRTFRFIPDATTGTKNETAWKRLQGFERSAAKLGHEIVWNVSSSTNALDHDQLVEIARP